ncbi:MAG: tyrosine-type recombinase/integrase [Ginsengibacter sp.]
MQPTQPNSIQKFLDYLSFQKRYSPNTVISYETDLLAFFDYLLLEYESKEVKDVSTVMVRSWLAQLKEKKNSAKTINRKISSLKSFFKYLLRNEEIQSNPAAVIQSLKVSRKLPAFIEEKDIAKIFVPGVFADSWDGKLNRLIFSILYNTGIRLNELIHLKESDIDKYLSCIKVLGKGNKDRLVPVSNHLISEIDSYITDKRLNFPGLEVPYLLLTHKGKMLYPKYVYNMVKLQLGNVSTMERKSPHILRHSFATHLTNHGAQINAIKELLGHSSLAATQIYTHNSIEKLKEVHKQAHPKS